MLYPALAHRVFTIAVTMLAAPVLQAQREAVAKPRAGLVDADSLAAAAATAPTSTGPRPTGLTPIVYRGTATVDFRWSGTAAATAHQLLRATGVGGPYHATAVNDSVRVNGLTHWARDYRGVVGSTRFYKVLVRYGDGTWGLSDPVTVTIPLPPRGITGLFAQPAGKNAVTLHWTGDPEATHYAVWRFRNWSDLETRFDVGANTTFTDTGLWSGANYRFMVVAKYADPNTSMYAEVSVKAP